MENRTILSKTRVQRGKGTPAAHDHSQLETQIKVILPISGGQSAWEKKNDDYVSTIAEQKDPIWPFLASKTDILNSLTGNIPFSFLEQRKAYRPGFVA